jgi:hypothetical protein
MRNFLQLWQYDALSLTMELQYLQVGFTASGVTGGGALGERNCDNID